MAETLKPMTGGRNWRVDTLRGYFLVMMTVAHLRGNPLALFTEYALGYASAPDGFVFLSGLVSGWVYLKTLARSGVAALERRALSRAGTVYLVHLSLLTLAIAGAVWGRNTSFRGTHPVQALAAGALLIYQPALSDILPMYCIFLLLTPLVLRKLVKGQLRPVILISAAVWLLSQLGVGDSSTLVPWIYLGKFNIFAWQAYFAAGLCFAWWVGSRQGSLPKSQGLLALCAVVAGLLFVDRHLHVIAGMSPLLRFKNEPDHNPVRFLDAACLGYVIYRVPAVVDGKLKQWRVFQFLNLLGQHSLQVFAFSLLATFFVSWLGPRWDALGRFPKALAVGLVVLALAIPARLHEYYRRRQRRPASSLFAAAGAVSPATASVE